MSDYLITEGAKPAVAVIGLGAMGAPMAANLLKAGFDVTVHNRTRNREKPLVELGARRAESPEAASRDADIVITMVSDVPDVTEVICGFDGVLNGIRADKLVIDMSTIGPKAARKIAQSCAQSNVRFMDAPVSGGPIGAQNATMAIMAGGSEQDYATARGVFGALGGIIELMGPVGAGQATKMVNQVIGAINFSAVAEGLVLCKALGINQTKAMSVIGGGAASSWMTQHLASKMIAHDFGGGFKVDLQVKDLRLALENADELGLPMPLTRVVVQFLKAAQAAGHGEQGTQSVISVLEP